MIRFLKRGFLACLLFILVSCNEDPNTLVDTPQPLVDFFSFINAKVNGTQINTDIPSTGTPNYEATISYFQQNDTNGDCKNYNYNAGLSPISDSILPSFNVGFIGFLDEASQMCDDELSVFETLFEVGSYDYALTAQGKGANVRYVNSTGTYSSYGMQDASANFNITRIEIKDCVDKKCVNVLGTFNVRLYDVSDFTSFIDVSEGNFKVRVRSFN